MTRYPQLKIKDDRIAAIQRRHPWIFSRGILKHDPIEDGEIVEVVSRKGHFQAIGYYQDGSIMVRVLTFIQEEIDDTFWLDKIQEAYNLRKNLGIISNQTNAYRLLHGEGDGLPGLVVDIYAEIAVIQCHAIGMHRQLPAIQLALETVLGDQISTIYDKSKNTLPEKYSNTITNGPIKGEATETEVLENGHRFHVDLVTGQKTGFFLDQRDNRDVLSRFSKDKAVLNLYCYTGGFSVYALEAGAKKVLSIDASKTAVALMEKNIALTKNADRHESLVQDVNRYLKEIPIGEYDTIIVDPPAFAKSVRKKHNAIQAYKRVNSMALQKLKPGGTLFTFSCSQVIDAQLFYNTITAAAIDAGRNCRVIRHLSQGADHPVNIFHPEGKYLKGLVLVVEG